MEEKRDLWDILFVPVCVVGAFIFYIMCNIGYQDSMFEVIVSKLSLFAVMAVWAASAYSFIKEKFRSTAYNTVHNLIAAAAASLFISLLFWFIDCCLFCVIEQGSNVIDMIKEAPVIFVKSYFMSTGLLKLGFWFLYCCVVCHLVHMGDKYNWLERFARRIGLVFEEDIVDIKENTLILPFEYEAKKAKLYFTVNGKGMLFAEPEFENLKEYTEETIKNDSTDENSVKFMELLNDAIDLCSEDGKTFTFDSSHLEKFVWEHYEVQVEEFWCELIPLNLVKNKELGEKKKEKPAWCKLFSLSFLIPVCLFVVLTYKLIGFSQMWFAYGIDKLFSGLKYISYISLMMIVATICNLFIVNGQSSTRKKVLTCVISTLIVLISIILLNNMYHFLAFGYEFNWPEGVTYFMFLRDDILYHQGVGMLRFPAVVMLYLAIYFFQQRQTAKKWWKTFKDALVESLTSDKE